MTAATLSVSPNLLALWIKILRETLDSSQEALAEAAGVNIRTVQRVENSGPSSATTRRCLARGLGCDDHGVFDDPVFAEIALRMIGKAQRETSQSTP